MFKPIKNKKKYQLIIEQIQNMILDNSLKKGDKLPSERELALKLGVSRTSIREALRSLEILGIVESRQGEGTFVSEKTDGIMFEPLSVMFKLAEGSFDDVLQLRYIIEIETVRLAALRIKEEDKKELTFLVENLKNAKDENDRVNYDMQIHYKIAEISGNNLINSLLNAITHLMDTFIREARRRIFVWKNDTEVLLKVHVMVCQSIIEGRPDEAVKYIKQHFEHVIESSKLFRDG